MQGLGVFACRRAAWPGFNPRLCGFGGEEGYLHEKVRRAGGRTLCLPFLRWMHRFVRPSGPPYSVSLEDRVRNYLLVHDELGLDPAAAIEHLEGQFGAARVRPLVDAATEELRGPLHAFDAIYRLDLESKAAGEEPVEGQDPAHGVARRVRRFAMIDTPHDPAVGRALSHRAIVAEARWLGLTSVLVLEDGARLSPAIEDALARRLAGVSGRPWRLLHLGGRDREPGATQPHGRPPGPPSQVCADASAVAIHERAYEEILAELPATPTAMVRWLRDSGGLEPFYARRVAR
jgi:hypothetical protein